MARFGRTKSPGSAPASSPKRAALRSCSSPLRARTREEYAIIDRLIGGHPRMLEYLDGLLRGGSARFAEVEERLLRLAGKLGIGIGEADNLPAALRSSLLIGAHDILLGALLAAAREAGDEPAFLHAT